MHFNQSDVAYFALSPTAIVLEGWLWKQGEAITGGLTQMLSQYTGGAYKKRWFRLKGNLLFYFDTCPTTSPSSPVGFILLDYAHVEIETISSSSSSSPTSFFPFALKFPSTESARVYHLAANTPQERETWMTQLKLAQWTCIYQQLKSNLIHNSTPSSCRILDSNSNIDSLQKKLSNLTCDSTSPSNFSTTALPTVFYGFTLDFQLHLPLWLEKYQCKMNKEMMVYFEWNQTSTPPLEQPPPLPKLQPPFQESENHTHTEWVSLNTLSSSSSRKLHFFVCLSMSANLPISNTTTFLHLYLVSSSHQVSYLLSTVSFPTTTTTTSSLSLPFFLDSTKILGQLSIQRYPCLPSYWSMSPFFPSLYTPSFWYQHYQFTLNQPIVETLLLPRLTFLLPMKLIRFWIHEFQSHHQRLTFHSSSSPSPSHSSCLTTLNQWIHAYQTLWSQCEAHFKQRVRWPLRKSTEKHIEALSMCPLNLCVQRTFIHNQMYSIITFGAPTLHFSKERKKKNKSNSTGSSLFPSSNVSEKQSSSSFNNETFLQTSTQTWHQFHSLFQSFTNQLHQLQQEAQVTSFSTWTTFQPWIDPIIRIAHTFATQSIEVLQAMLAPKSTFMVAYTLLNTTLPLLTQPPSSSSSFNTNHPPAFLQEDVFLAFLTLQTEMKALYDVLQQYLCLLPSTASPDVSSTSSIMQTSWPWPHHQFIFSQCLTAIATAFIECFGYWLAENHASLVWAYWTQVGVLVGCESLLSNQPNQEGQMLLDYHSSLLQIANQVVFALHPILPKKEQNHEKRDTEDHTSSHSSLLNTMKPQDIVSNQKEDGPDATGDKDPGTSSQASHSFLHEETKRNAFTIGTEDFSEDEDEWIQVYSTSTHLVVSIGLPESIFCTLTHSDKKVKMIPILFTQGINEQETLTHLPFFSKAASSPSSMSSLFHPYGPYAIHQHSLYKLKQYVDACFHYLHKYHPSSPSSKLLTLRNYVDLLITQLEQLIRLPTPPSINLSKTKTASATKVALAADLVANPSHSSTVTSTSSFASSKTDPIWVSSSTSFLTHPNTTLNGSLVPTSPSPSSSSFSSFPFSSWFQDWDAQNKPTERLFLAAHVTRVVGSILSLCTLSSSSSSSSIFSFSSQPPPFGAHCSTTLRLTSCKSAKDRTSMSVTLEQSFLCLLNHRLPSTDWSGLVHALRSQGVRLMNVVMNVGQPKYAFNSLQWPFLPKLYRPPKFTTAGYVPG